MALQLQLKCHIENRQDTLSVVVAAYSGLEPVVCLLESLQRLSRGARLEVVIANCCGDPAGKAMAQRFPEVEVVSLPCHTTIAEARDAAVGRTRGSVVAVLHERYSVPHDWLDRVLAAHRTHPAKVIAGAVAPQSGLSLPQWAMYLTEYAHTLSLPAGILERGAAVMIPGGNCSYKREVFANGSMAGYLWEIDFHRAAFDGGAQFYRDEGIVAEWATPYTIRDYIAERVKISCDLARREAAGKPLSGRVVAAAARLALPPLIVLRVGRAALRSKTYTGRFFLALPWIAAFAGVQAWGEIMGYLGWRR